MIISASYKTDIPTFYGRWFMNRLDAGYCKYINPYNQRPCTVSLRREEVDGFIFWTKNIGPFEKHLPEISSRGYPFIIQHTINGYPPVLEQRVVDAIRATESLKRVADKFGSDVCVWRYDTIIFSNLTPYAFHVESFARLASALRGVVNEVVISFVQLYEKTTRNFNEAKKDGLLIHTPTLAEKHRLVGEFVEIGRRNGICVSVCTQPEYVVNGAQEAKCVDAARLTKVAARIVSAPIKGNRKDCGCHESRDIGEYDTCPHGCIYCYAVKKRELALTRFAAHNPESEFLFPPPQTDSDQLSFL